MENSPFCTAAIEPEVRTSFAQEARRLGNVPLLPQSARVILAMLNDPVNGMERVALAVRQDPALATNLLKTANSAGYRGARPISTLPAALVRLGTTGVHRLLLTMAAARVLNIRGRSSLALRLQGRAVAVSTAAARIAVHLGSDPEAAFLGGLLHDVGWAIGYGAVPAVLPKLPHIYREKPALLDLLIGPLHTDLGSVTAEAWKLPPSVVDTIRAHHDPAGLGGGLTAHIVYAASRIADLAGIVPEDAPPGEPADDPILARLRIDGAVRDRFVTALQVDIGG